MLGFRPKLPIPEEDRGWVDEGFHRLEKALGRARMLDAQVVLPVAEHFPDPYDCTKEAVDRLFERVCQYMRVDSCGIDLKIFADQTDELREILPYWRGDNGGCAGFYRQDNAAARAVVALRSSQLKDTLALVATMAHELGHVILLGGRLIPAASSDMEPLTDLATVFLGLGIFNANCASRFRQYQDERKQGWSMTRLGYLPEQIYGYALAKFASERNENNPKWSRYLTSNVRADFKQSCAWLEEHAGTSSSNAR